MLCKWEKGGERERKGVWMEKGELGIKEGEELSMPKGEQIRKVGKWGRKLFCKGTGDVQKKKVSTGYVQSIFLSFLQYFQIILTEYRCLLII